MYDSEFETKNKIEPQHIFQNSYLRRRVGPCVFRLLRLSNDCKTEYISGKAKASYKVIQQPV